LPRGCGLSVSFRILKGKLQKKIFKKRFGKGEMTEGTEDEKGKTGQRERNKTAQGRFPLFGGRGKSKAPCRGLSNFLPGQRGGCFAK